ncbi:Adenosine 3'-phospho 5'-phosphosulfate transporter 2 [Seminavis robusta]|uniref:Adenosine 3'-phospho 5'-phosphosulfate transporter 2 n=1 Tax=Seminavis robusta TaxID=568900 RepID=A0A9N8F2M7_9STRA|nr:Adenosine 3'-phospho 5'-phosphosulfate transporter 2 [Seminavis robusta]|eukprot:Sro2876_g339150.1 Adenosine 3'-phospho 5'-phosphosulfate transporter 2 (370) ;mRNA; r:3964-5170
MTQPRSPTNEQHAVARLEKKFEQLGRPAQFIVLVAGVFFFFGIHNLLQETMMSIEGFHFGIMLGYMEVLGVAVCSYLERTYYAKETGRVAPMSAYPLLTFCLMSSSSLSNLALNFINFPTKVVFRSCKLIPTMLVASIIHRKVFSSKEYSCALAICAGLVMFAAADWKLSPTFHPVGLTLVSLSVCADAILPNAQENLFRMGSSRLEVTFFTNIFTLMVMTVTTLASGDLIGLLQFARTSHTLRVYMLIYTFIAYIAISVHMTIVKRFGGVAAVLVATVRKAMTLVLSFVIFPKEFSWFYVLGAALVLGGLTVSSLSKMEERKASDRVKNSKESGTDLEDASGEETEKMLEHTESTQTEVSSSNSSWSK